MDFLFAMSVFSSAADISRENGKVQEWLSAWVVARDDNHGGAAAAAQGKPQQRQRDPRGQQAKGAQEKKPQGRPWLAPEFDGLNCFETFVSH